MPSLEFAQRLESVRNLILKKYTEDSENVSTYKVKEWYDYAKDLWSFTSKLSGISEYKSLD